jgi:WD40 repeat protein
VPFASAQRSKARSLLATSTEGGEVDLWDFPKGGHRLKYAAHQSEVFGVAISPDNSLIASSEMDDELHLWKASDGELLARLPLECRETITFSPDGRFVAGAGGDVVFLDAKRIASLDGRDAVIWELGK